MLLLLIKESIPSITSVLDQSVTQPVRPSDLEGPVQGFVHVHDHLASLYALLDEGIVNELDFAVLVDDSY